MARLIALFALLFFVVSCVVAGEPQTDILVTPDWIEEHMSDPSLVILQAADLRSVYARGHIPGARFLWPGWLEKSTPDLNVELFPVATMDSVLESLGVSNSSLIVLCHSGSFPNAVTAARTWVVLEYLGMGDRTKILDGGFEHWKSQGKPVSKEVPQYAPGNFALALKENVFVDMEFVKASLGQPGIRPVDTRRPDDFAGKAEGEERTGHLPGAVSIPYSTIIDRDLRYFPLDTLKARFAEAGVGPGEEIIAYCYRGKSACLAYIAARMLGFDAHVYDGSMEEWTAYDDSPLEVTPEEK